MKKTLVLSALVVSAFTLVGCGEKEAPAVAPAPAVVETPVTPPEAPAVPAEATSETAPQETAPQETTQAAPAEGAAAEVPPAAGDSTPPASADVQATPAEPTKPQ